MRKSRWCDTSTVMQAWTGKSGSGKSRWCDTSTVMQAWTGKSGKSGSGKSRWCDTSTVMQAWTGKSGSGKSRWCDTSTVIQAWTVEMCGTKWKRVGHCKSDNISPMIQIWLPWWCLWADHCKRSIFRKDIPHWWTAYQIMAAKEKNCWLLTVTLWKPHFTIATKIRDAVSGTNCRACAEFLRNAFSSFGGNASQTESETANLIFPYYRMADGNEQLHNWCLTPGFFLLLFAVW